MRKIATVLALALLTFGSVSVNAQGVSEEQYQQMLQQMYGGGNPMDHQIKQPKATGGDLGSNAAADQMEMLKNLSNNIKKNSDARAKNGKALAAKGKSKSEIKNNWENPELLKQILESTKKKDPRTIQVTLNSPTWRYERDKFGNIIYRYVQFSQVYRDSSDNKVYCGYESYARQAFNGTGYDEYMTIILDTKYQKFYVNDWDEAK